MSPSAFCIGRPTQTRAAELGAEVQAQLFDVYDVGRMAVIRDPTGAVFSVWQPKKNIGTGLAGVDGALCWADLMIPDQEREGFPFKPVRLENRKAKMRIRRTETITFEMEKNSSAGFSRRNTLIRALRRTGRFISVFRTVTRSRRR
ncbi:MAG TPA: hypothetical protein VOA64_00125 [Candidatus Dormibacteraeota bacterium]|nr:hypothetical protein [Candidatus Dormibacteraeota bacterium]